jgi:hypothetical protein
MRVHKNGRIVTYPETRQDEFRRDLVNENIRAVSLLRDAKKVEERGVLTAENENMRAHESDCSLPLRLMETLDLNALLMRIVNQ